MPFADDKAKGIRHLGLLNVILFYKRRKLLGLYAPEKKDISGDLSFAALLVESGMIDEAEEQING